MRFVDTGGYAVEIRGRRSARQPWGSRLQRVTVLCHSKSGYHFRDASFVHLTLDFTNAIKRKPPDETGCNDKRHSATNAQIELR